MAFSGEHSSWSPPQELLFCLFYRGYGGRSSWTSIERVVQPTAFFRIRKMLCLPMGGLYPWSNQVNFGKNLRVFFLICHTALEIFTQSSSSKKLLKFSWAPNFWYCFYRLHSNHTINTQEWWNKEFLNRDKSEIILKTFNLINLV